MEAEYSDALNDPENDEFKSLANLIISMCYDNSAFINALELRQPLSKDGPGPSGVEGYINTVVVSFSPGSVNAQTISSFLNISNVTSDDLQTHFDGEATIRSNIFSNLTLGNIAVKEFEDSVCILPGRHDCHKYASCIDEDDGSFTCQCKSDYQDDSEEPSDRPGRLCSEMSSDHLLIIAVGLGILSGLLLISVTVFIVQCCHVYRTAEKLTKVPVMDDFPPAVHPLIDLGSGTNEWSGNYNYGFDSGIYPDPEIGNDFELDNRTSTATSHFDERVEDEKIDSLERHLTNISTGRTAPFISHDLDSQMTADPLAPGDTFIRPYVATGDEAKRLYLARKFQDDLPDRDYPNAKYYQSQARAGLKSGNQERRKGVPERDYPDAVNSELMDAEVDLGNVAFSIPRAAVSEFRLQTTDFA
ncbi:uncharacterized protein [Ptychodera flava]|uniref:uncharacterized protein n=1 Tax=Ptychodera flava TaxID=63121 RepID=UPI003969F4AE